MIAVTQRRARQGGFTLIEVLISMVVLLVAAMMLLVMYDSGWAAYKLGENAAAQQQGVRIAFDKVTLDLQMAGFNYGPDGIPLVDEQIEAAFDTAVVIRADFDAQDAILAATPEASLADPSAGIETVSTGNDEIVAYVLAKPDGSSTDTLTFEADVQDVPRDGTLETINIPNVALVQDDPPYTLYRISLNNDVAKWGTPEFFVRTVLAENVYSMTYRYYDVGGTQINSTFNLGSTVDDIGGDDLAAAELRSSIARIELDVTGLTRDPDLHWVDSSDSNPITRSYRKFSLSADISPRNVGMFGVEDIRELP